MDVVLRIKICYNLYIIRGLGLLLAHRTWKKYHILVHTVKGFEESLKLFLSELSNAETYIVT
jgi:hypothetical protein